jgi:hypothetical protein
MKIEDVEKAVDLLRSFSQSKENLNGLTEARTAKRAISVYVWDEEDNELISTKIDEGEMAAKIIQAIIIVVKEYQLKTLQQIESL